MTVDGILIIDDDLDILGLLEEGLQMHVDGPITTMADTSVAAERILDGRYKPRIVVSDYDNIGASGDRHGGYTLYEALKAAGKMPDHFIMISGYRQDQLPPLPDDVTFMRKPLQMGIFGREIKEKYDQ